VVNVAQVAREYGLDRKAVARHRDQHLPQFLRAFAGRAAVLDVSKIQAEAERLYLTTLDALARAEQGTLTRIDEDGKARPSVSYSAIARFIREARQGLDLLAKLSLASDTRDTPPNEVNPQLDARIAAALERVERRALRGLQRHNIVDAEVVAP